TGDPRFTITDSVGRFAFDSVPRGRYIIGFFHALLDSLTLEPILREIEVVDVPVRIDLATPASTGLRRAFCLAPRGSNPPAALVGIVRNAATGEPLAGASVIGEWTDLTFDKGRVVPMRSHRFATSAANGWFALCGVPGPGTVALTASLGVDSTDRLDLPVPRDGFLRRDLYVGAARISNRQLPGDTLSRTFRGGEGRLTGTVWSTKAAPLAGAIVSVANGSRTRANDDGAWTLNDLPMGTRMVEMRAIGYYPERRAVDIIPGATPVNVMLPTFESVLDTVRVRALGPAAQWTGFEDRRRSLGMGRFLSEDDIRKRNVINASDLFRSMAGMRVEAGDIKMRSAFGDPGAIFPECTPTLYLNGRAVPAPFGMSTDDIDTWVRPGEIRGIEVYVDVVPAQFQQAMSGCGAIVIWTKR
ncbi:MAG: carboxypeptidase-like regulatory domain-containing protein, partial [Gemmatimonadaceae bacterium]